MSSGAPDTACRELEGDAMMSTEAHKQLVSRLVDEV